jgi:hypothetical protein
MPAGRPTLLLLFVFSAAVTVWAFSVESQIGLPVWGDRPSGIALSGFGALLLAWGLVSPELGRWFPRPVYGGIAILCFGVSMIAGSRAGLWLISPVAAITGCVLALAGYGTRQTWLPPDDEEPPTLHERVRFLFSCAVPWIAVYEFTVHMRLPGRAFQFEFEDQLPIYPVTSLIYQSTYAAVTFAPFLARTRRQLRRLTISGWVATALIFPFYWLVPSTAPRRPMSGDGFLARLLSFERNTYPPSAAFPSFHVLWSIFIGRAMRPQVLGWLYAIAVAVSCITTGMHYIPDVLVSFLIAPLFMYPDRFGIGPQTLSWRTAYIFLSVVVIAMLRHSAPESLAAGVALIGVAQFQWAAKRR